VDGLGAQRADRRRRALGAHERDDLVAAVAQRRDEPAAQQPGAAGDERAAQERTWSVSSGSCASRAGGCSGASARRAEAKATR
jgi:hypothetical protein